MKLRLNLFAQAGACAALGLAAWLSPLPVSAATEAPQRASRAEMTQLLALHQQELAACRNGQTKQTVAACVKEAYASYAQARRGGLDDGNAAYRENARVRCEAFSGSDKEACIARMQGQGTTTGTVEDGGILRELTTVISGPTPRAMQQPRSVKTPLMTPPPGSKPVKNTPAVTPQ